MSTNLSDEEWMALHGYDAVGKPKQRYVWEGAPDGAPTKKESGVRWLLDTAATNLVVCLEVKGDVWVADGIEGPINKVQNTHVCTEEEGYVTAIKKAYAMYLLRSRQNDST